jgi:protein O-mannosyl-transferase
MLPLLLLAVGVFAVYSHTFGHEFLINWDDETYILRNEAIRGLSLPHLRTAFSAFFVGNYAPVQIISYMLDYELWGLHAAGFLGTNLFLHALNGILFYILVEKLCTERLVAFGAAFIFLFHPVQVESVAWVSERKNLLAMTFFLASLLWYCRYREQGGKGFYSASFGAFILALLSKAVVVVLPLVAMLYDYCYASGKKRAGITDKIPYFVASLALGILALVSHSAAVNEGSAGIRPYPGGSIVATVCTMLPVLAEYLGDCFYPVGLNPYYLTRIRTAPDLTVALSALLALLLVAGGIYLARRNRHLLFWYGLFFAGLLPYAQIVPLITLKVDRALYFPMLGFATLASWGAVALVRRWYAWRTPLLAAITVIICTLPVLTWRQSLIWRDAVTLWTYAVHQDPENQVGWEMLALAHTRQRNGDAAREALGHLLELRRRNGPARGWE